MHNCVLLIACHNIVTVCSLRWPKDSFTEEGRQSWRDGGIFKALADRRFHELRDGFGLRRTKIAAWMLILLVNDIPYTEMKAGHCSRLTSERGGFWFLFFLFGWCEHTLLVIVSCDGLLLTTYSFRREMSTPGFLLFSPSLPLTVPLIAILLRAATWNSRGQVAMAHL